MPRETLSALLEAAFAPSNTSHQASLCQELPPSPRWEKQGSEEQGSDASPGINSLEHFNTHVMKAADPRLALCR